MTDLTLRAGSDAKMTPLNDHQLDGLLTGNTIYIGLPPGGPGGPNGGEAAFHYGEDGRASAQVPAGTKMVGQWTINGDKYCVSWDGGPQNSCTQIVKVDGTIELRDAESGDPRGKVSRISPGNSEAL